MGPRGPDRLLNPGRRRLDAAGQQDGATRLGFALMLKYFELDARFARHAGDVEVEYPTSPVSTPETVAMARWHAAPAKQAGRPPGDLASILEFVRAKDPSLNLPRHYVNRCHLCNELFTRDDVRRVLWAHAAERQRRSCF